MQKDSKRSIAFGFAQAIFVALACFVAVSVWFLLGSDASSRRRTDVVVILVDTLRADRLPWHGHTTNTAPFLSSLAESGVIFERAVSTCSYTAPAVASIFTGLLPSEHGVLTGHFAHKRLLRDRPSMRLNRIPERLTTIAEVFKNAGYTTIGIADNPNISNEMGFGQGFDALITHSNRGALAVHKSFRELLPRFEASNNPRFLYLHYMEPHKPYIRHSPWFQPGASKADSVRSAYDSEIHYLDARIAELFQEHEWLNNALLVVLSDHGEEFWDHGGTGHGKTLHKEVLHVPLFVRDPRPGAPRHRVKEYVSTKNMAPLLFTLAELPVPAQWRSDRVLAGYYGANLKRGRVFSELLKPREHPGPTWLSVIEAPLQLLVRPGPPDNESVRKSRQLLRLPDHELGARESRVENAADADRLHNLILRREQVSVETEAVEIPVDEESLRQLESLGYTG